MENAKKYYKFMLLVFLIAFVPRAVLALIYGAPFSVPRDEMSTIASSAMMAGYDWSNVAMKANSYYGGGYVIFFAPLFKMGLDSLRIYDIMLVVSCALQAVGAPICYYIMEKYFKVTKKGVLIGASVAASFLVSLRVMMIFNEHMLIAVSWLIALSLCKLIEHNENYGKKTVYTILLMVELSYIVTCHTRVKTYWYALIVLVFIFWFLYKKWLVAVIPAITIGASGYLLSGKFIEYVKTLVWHWEEGKKLKNSYVNLNVSLSDFTEASTYKAIFSTILGQINGTFVLSAGIFCILIVVIVCLWYKKIKNVVCVRYFHKEVLEEESTGEKIVLMLSMFFGMCIVATTLAQCLTWLGRVQVAYEGGRTYGYKAFSYVRYNAIYFGPFFAAGMGALYQQKDKLKPYLKASVAVFAIVFLGWVLWILPYIKGVAAASKVYIPFGYLWYNFAEKKYGIGMYWLSMFVVALSFSLFVVLLWKKKWKISVLLLSLLLVYEYSVGAVAVDGASVKKYYGKAGTTYQVFQKAEEMEKSNILPESLYISIKETTSMKRTYTYQFLLYDYKIIWDLPPEDIEEAIVLSDMKSEPELFGMGYLCSQLDKDEFIYVKGENLIAVFENLGYTFYGN